MSRPSRGPPRPGQRPFIQGQAQTPPDRSPPSVSLARSPPTYTSPPPPHLASAYLPPAPAGPPYRPPNASYISQFQTATHPLSKAVQIGQQPFQAPPPAFPAPQAIHVRKEAKSSVDRAPVELRSIDFPATVARCRVSIDAFEQLLRGHLTDWKMMMPDEGAKSALVVALKLRMVHVVRQSLFFAKRRRTAALPPNPVYFDVPVCRFALLRAEGEIMRFDCLPCPDAGNAPPVIQKFRNEAIAAVAAQSTEPRRDEFLAIARDSEDVWCDDTQVVDLVPRAKKDKRVTDRDVIAFIEIDSARPPAELLIERMRLARAGNT